MPHKTTVRPFPRVGPLLVGGLKWRIKTYRAVLHQSLLHIRFGYAEADDPIDFAGFAGLASFHIAGQEQTERRCGVLACGLSHKGLHRMLAAQFFGIIQGGQSAYEVSGGQHGPFDGAILDEA